jgi:hypothetical protein
MFRWLRFPTTHDLVTDYMCSIDPSYRKKQYLEQQLSDAEWILAHEKRLISLQKKTTAQRSRAEQLGANTDRLRRLEHHLAGLRRSLD